MPGHRDYMFALMKAVSKDQNTLSYQQIIDAKTTELDVSIEANIYQYWTAKEQMWVADINKYINAQYKGHPDKGEKEYDQKMVKHCQAEYSMVSAEGQSNASEEDGTVQAAQGQASSDAMNLSMKAQMVQGINNILTMLVNMLGRITA